jgi:hypothetical protein
MGIVPNKINISLSLHSPPPKMHNQRQTGLFTRNPRAMETLAYFLFIGVFVWLCLSTQGGAESFMLTSNIRTAFAGFLEVRDDEVEHTHTHTFSLSLSLSFSLSHTHLLCVRAFVLCVRAFTYIVSVNVCVYSQKYTTQCVYEHA